MAQSDREGRLEQTIRNDDIAFPPALERFLEERASDLNDTPDDARQISGGLTDEEAKLRIEISRRLLQKLDILSEVEALHAAAQERES